MDKNLLSLRQIKRGNLFRLYTNGVIYFRGPYDRKSGYYVVKRVSSVGRNSSTPDEYFLGDTLVYPVA